MNLKDVLKILIDSLYGENLVDVLALIEGVSVLAAKNHDTIPWLEVDEVKELLEEELEDALEDAKADWEKENNQ